MKTSGSIELSLRKFVAPEYIFGIDARKLAANYCKKLAAENILLVTDKGLQDTPLVNELELLLQKEGLAYTIYDAVSPNPRDYEVMKGAEVYKANKCNIIVALGGGSVLDCAKGIGIVVTNFNDIRSFEGIDKIEKPTPPLICIPTTAGSSADVSQFAIINNTQEKYKMAIISKALVPDVSLIDPIALEFMGSYLTACTGMDALAHAFEAYVSNANSPFTDLYAIESIKLIHDNLIYTILNPENLQARGKTALGSLYAGLAFSNASLGCVHSLAHSLGGYLDLPHGECNAILLPHVVDYNFDSANDRYKNIAKIFNLDVENLPLNKVKTKLVDYLIEFKKNVTIIDTLKNKGVKTDIINALADKAIKDPCNATNPKAPTKTDLATIYSEAL
ncbi:MAG TPA: iron-containing alcohol dehydrogenase [Melioribacteraceae bacterium]|nr:iron-containing alcohol dehydrogenase [Melioribacteraceae bacterium]